MVFWTITINMYGQHKKFLLSLQQLRLIPQKYLNQSQNTKYLGSSFLSGSGVLGFCVFTPVVFIIS